MKQINNLPTPPSLSDLPHFEERANAFVNALPAFVEQTNALANELNTTLTDSASIAKENARATSSDRAEVARLKSQVDLTTSSSISQINELKASIEATHEKATQLKSESQALKAEALSLKDEISSELETVNDVKEAIKGGLINDNAPNKLSTYSSAKLDEILRAGAQKNTQSLNLIEIAYLDDKASMILNSLKSKSQKIGEVFNQSPLIKTAPAGYVRADSAFNKAIYAVLFKRANSAKLAIDEGKDTFLLNLEKAKELNDKFIYTGVENG